jgi:uncharacterized membrane protein (UPF0127 family)
MGKNERIRAKNRQQLALLVVFAVLVGLFFFYISRVSSEWSLLKVTFSEGASVKGPVYLKIASTGEEREKGLMYVKTLDPDRGMLFVFAEESQKTFWMKNTYISLDMLFISKDQKIAGIIKNAPVLNTDPQSVQAKSMYVIELPAGTAERLAIKQGDQVNFEGPIPKGVGKF